MADGTSATTVASAPAGAAELEAAVLVAAADVDDEVGAAAADDVEDDELLLPQPTMAAAHTSGTAMDNHVLIERIALLLIGSQKTGGRIGNIASAWQTS
jgi:hypothetical protein